MDGCNHSVKKITLYDDKKDKTDPPGETIKVQKINNLSLFLSLNKITH